MTGYSIALTGYIYPSEDGMLISHCNELDIDTCGDTFEEIQGRTMDMIRAYFVACQRLGTYREVMDRLLETSREAMRCSIVPGQWTAVPTDLARLQFSAEFRELRG